ncbi:MAG: helix-turn-helix domain-containing protein [Mariprofundaceae bacterium]|nr:helix-turn-helix domain-containing protein [Mariprofundaceae bacterium]
MTTTKEMAASTAAIPKTTNLNDTSAAAQCMRLKAALNDTAIMNTYEIRHDLDIMEVAARIWDLRNKYGCDIHTQMLDVESGLGVKHKIAHYSLISEIQGSSHA